MSDNGKGSVARPFSVSPESFSSSYERIFGTRPTRTPYVPAPLSPEVEGQAIPQVILPGSAAAPTSGGEARPVRRQASR